MNRFLSVLIVLWLLPLWLMAQVPNQVVNNGDATAVAKFPGSACGYIWTNNQPSIGLPQSGAGDVPSFTAINTTGVPVVATITATAGSNYPPYPLIISQFTNRLQAYNLHRKAGDAADPTPILGGKPYGVAISPVGDLAYVANQSSGTVTVLRVGLFNTLATIHVGTGVGAGPTGLIVSPDGKRVYVANNTEGSISVIDAVNNGVLNTFNVGLNPTGVAISPDGSKLYVAMSGSNALWVINTTDYSTLKIINGTPAGPTGLALSPDGSKLYVTCKDADKLMVINTAGNTIAANISTGLQPFCAVVSPDGSKVYVSENGSGQVAIIDAGSNTVTGHVTVGSKPVGIDITPDGSQVMVCNNGSGSMSIINTSTNVVDRTVSDIDAQPFSFGRFIMAPVSCSSAPVTFTITVNPTPPSITVTGAPTAMTTSFGVPSAPGTFSVTGLSLTEGIKLTAPAGFEISADGQDYSAVLTIGAAGNIGPATIYVRLAADASVGNHSGNIVVSSQGVSPVNVSIPNSTVTDAVPYITVSPATGNISACAGSPSVSPFLQQFTVSAVSLSAVFNAAAPLGFEVSLNEAGPYASNVDIPTASGKVSPITIYVRLSATAVGKVSGKVMLSSPGATTRYVDVFGVAYATPSVNPVANQTVENGANTTLIHFTGTNANTFTWTNDTPEIGLAASGTGDIAPFKAINTGSTPLTAVVSVTPVSIPLAYVALSGAGQLQIVDIQNNKVVGTIPVGQKPTGVLVNIDGSRVYVANSGSNTVSVINTANNSVIANIPVGRTPQSMALSADGNTLTVYNYLDQTVSTINTADNSVTGTTAVGLFPPGTHYTNDGKVGFIIPIQSNEMNPPFEPYSTATKFKLGALQQGETYSALTLSPDGKRVYVATSGVAKVFVYDALDYHLIGSVITGTLPVFPSPVPGSPPADPGAQPEGVSLNRDGSMLYVTNQHDNTITVINTATLAVVTQIPTGGTNSNPYGIAVANGSGCSGTPVSFSIIVNPTPPTIIANGTFDVLTTDYGTPSANDFFTVSGINLTEGVLVTPPPGFEVSLDGINFSNTVIAGTGGNMPDTKVYIRLAASTPVGTYAGDITLSSQGATAVKLTMPPCNVIENRPTIIATTATGVISACLGMPSSSPNVQQFKFFGSLLTSDVVIAAPAGFEVSLDINSNYSNSISIPPSGGKINSTTVYVRSSALATVGFKSGNVTLTSAGAISRTMAVTGTINDLPRADQVPSQVKAGGQPTDPISFTGTGNTYIWANDHPEIGLVANGSGDIGSFTAINNTSAPIVATVTVTPMSAAFAYIPVQNGNRVTVVNTSSGKVEGAPISVGASPYAVAASPDGTRVYVANQGTNTVSVINTATNTVQAPITVGNGPSGLVVSPDGSRLYVANGSDNSVSVVNTQTGVVIARPGVGISPRGIAISPDGSKVYVANLNSNSVSVINTASPASEVLPRITVGKSPQGIVISPDGSKIYVTNYNDKTVTVITAATGATSTILVGDNPGGIAITPDGSQIYVTHGPANRITIINTATNATQSVNVGTGPQGVAVSPDGTLVYVANFNSGNVSILSTITNTVLSAVTVNGSPVSLGNFITGGTGCSGQPMKFTITVNPQAGFITTSGTPDILTTTYGTASAYTSFTVSGISMKAGIVITAPTGFEVSTDNVHFSNSVTVGAAGIIPTTQVYIRLAAQSAVGSYTGNIRFTSTGSADANLNMPAGTVSPAQIIITADNKTKTYGTANPPLTVSYNGFVNGDTQAQVSTKPIVTTTADVTSPVGQYPITATGALALNYTFTYVAGVLTINPPEQVLVIPNTFSPNGDGINDTWEIKNLETYSNCTVQIFTRSGQSLFYSANYPKAWDGRYNGTDLPTGVYYYVISFMGKRNPVAGYVAIIR